MQRPHSGLQLTVPNTRRLCTLYKILLFTFACESCERQLATGFKFCRPAKYVSANAAKTGRLGEPGCMGCKAHKRTHARTLFGNCHLISLFTLRQTHFMFISHVCPFVLQWPS